jgi:hypothetical protein
MLRMTLIFVFLLKPFAFLPALKRNRFSTVYDIIIIIIIIIIGACGSVVVKALCHKPEGRGFDTRRCEFLNLPNPSGRTRPWGLLSL